MKKIILTLISVITMATTASAMTYAEAREQALFLTDKMAYELNLSQQQYEAAYEINLDYLMSIHTVGDVYADAWRQRNLDLEYILYDWQYTAFCAASYFFRPVYWNAGYWHFGIYSHYPHRTHFYFSRPAAYVSYRGGHSWRRNGGRSWYVARRETYRPAVHRNHYVGMRDNHREVGHSNRSSVAFKRNNNVNRNNNTYHNNNNANRNNDNGNRYNGRNNNGIHYNNGNSNSYTRPSVSSHRSSTRETVGHSDNIGSRSSSSVDNNTMHRGGSMGSTSGTVRSGGAVRSGGTTRGNAGTMSNGSSGSRGRR